MSTTRKKTGNKKTSKKTAAAGPRAESSRTATRRWSKQVMETSDALDLEQGVFRGRDPHRIALSLKRSAERSHRRKSSPYRSAMSMLTFYINRGGKNLSAAKRRKLEAAEDALRDLFGRE